MASKEAEWEGYKVRAVGQLKAMQLERTQQAERAQRAEEEAATGAQQLTAARDDAAAARRQARAPPPLQPACPRPLAVCSARELWAGLCFVALASLKEELDERTSQAEDDTAVRESLTAEVVALTRQSETLREAYEKCADARSPTIPQTPCTAHRDCTPHVQHAKAPEGVRSPPRAPTAPLACGRSRTPHRRATAVRRRLSPWRHACAFPPPVAQGGRRGAPAAGEARGDPAGGGRPGEAGGAGVDGAAVV
eukprot:74497-Prymnesium_polylepis.1